MGEMGKLGKMDLRRLVLRGWFYFRMGYSLYLTYPVALFGYASSIYYLAVKSIPFLNNLFPQFHIFLATAVVLLPIVGASFGWLHYKKMPFHVAELDIQNEASPYSTEIVTPVTLPSLRVLSELGKQHGIDCSDLDRIIRTTEEKFHLKSV